MGLCMEQDDRGDLEDDAGCELAPENECERIPCDLERSRCGDVRLGYYCPCDPGCELAGTTKFVWILTNV